MVPITPKNNNERRRAYRYPVEREALLTLDDGQQLKATLQDFCWGGLFVELRGGLDLIQSYYRKGQAHVEITFADAEYSHPAKFRLDTRVARITPNGMGLALQRSMPGHVYTDLGRPSKSPSADEPVKSPQAVACHLLFREHLPTLLDGFWKALPTALVDAAMDAKSNAEQNRYYETIALLNEQRVAITQIFQSAALASVASFDPNHTSSNPLLAPGDVEEGHLFSRGVNPEGDTELALVGYNDMDDWVSLVVEVKRLKDIFMLTLADLDNRLAASVSADLKNPFTPGMLGDALHQSLGSIPLSLEIRRTLYRLFRKSVIPPLEQLYRALLMELKPVGTRVRPASVSGPPSPALLKPAESAPPPNIPAAPAAVVSLPETVCPPPPPPPPASSPSPPEGLRPHRPSGVAQGTFSLLKAQRSMQSLQGRDSSDPSAMTYSNEEILAGLGRLEASSVDMDLVRQAGLDPNRMSPEQQQLVELSAGLLHRIIQGARLPAVLVDLLTRLQGPLTHLAFVDPGFIQTDGHSAKQFLNFFDDLAIGVSDGGEFADAPFKQILSDAMTRIQRDYPALPGVFDEVVQALAPVAKRFNELRVNNQARVLAACEGKQRLLEARQRINKLIDQRIAGRTVSAVVVDLLAAGWQDLLALVALRSGMSHETWTTHWGVIERLLAWLDPQNPSPFGPGDTVRLIKFVETQLNALNQPRAINPLLDELTATLLGEGIPRVRRPTRFVSLPAARPTETRSVSPIGSFALRPGDWLEFETAHGQWKLLRLVCLAETSQDSVWVDRKGLKRLEIKAPDLKGRLSQGKARIVENLDTPLVERMTFQMMQEINDRLLEQANQDPATEMPNRRGFLGALERRVLEPQGRFSGHILMVLELQGFRAITSNCGIEVGDKLLKVVAGMIRNHLGSKVLVGRLGDTAFGCLLMNQPVATTEAFSQKLLGQITQRRFRWMNQSFTVGAVAGLAEIEPRSVNAKEALKRADTACFIALQRGGNQIYYYQEGDNQQQHQQETLIRWAGRIDQVLELNSPRLFLRGQRIAPLNPQDPHAHYEVLLGVRDESGKVIPPGDFLPAAEHWGRMVDVDQNVVARLFTWIRQDLKRLDRLGGFAVNLSGQSLNDPAMLKFLEHQVETAGFAMDKITFEITESIALQGFHQMQDFIRQLRRYGCRFSLDDFGAGYSSYAYLKHLDVDYLKIDGSLVKDLATNESDKVVVRSIHEVAHSMGLKTIAEYVENQSILDILKGIGVDYAQGYFIEKPLPLDTLIDR